ncbi:MAG: hypothetical protein KDK23_09920 [Leptospiraceae bacterium]|nr:hypothetical protein [Leptospiraceae bacterium]
MPAPSVFWFLSATRLRLGPERTNELPEKNIPGRRSRPGRNIPRVLILLQFLCLSHCSFVGEDPDPGLPLAFLASTNGCTDPNVYLWSDLETLYQIHPSGMTTTSFLIGQEGSLTGPLSVSTDGQYIAITLNSYDHGGKMVGFFRNFGSGQFYANSVIDAPSSDPQVFRFHGSHRGLFSRQDGGAHQIFESQPNGAESRFYVSSEDKYAPLLTGAGLYFLANTGTIALKLLQNGTESTIYESGAQNVTWFDVSSDGTVIAYLTSGAPTQELHVIRSNDEKVYYPMDLGLFDMQSFALSQSGQELVVVGGSGNVMKVTAATNEFSLLASTSGSPQFIAWPCN